MKYIIDPDYYFCGWDGLPFAIFGEQMHSPQFLNREQFQLLWSCDGKHEIEQENLNDDTAALFDWAIQEQIVRKVPEGTRLRLHEYKRYPCRYRSEIQLSITGKCNYKCRHCFQSAPHGILGQPTTEEVCRELDQIAECGIRNVSITGGEPLIHQGFWEIIDYMGKVGIRLTTVYSNGKLIDQKLLDGFKERGLFPDWQISFDGLGEHDHMRGVEGAEKSAVDAIKLLAANGFSVSAAYTLTKRTAPVFRKSVNFLASLGVHSLKSGCTQAQGEWINSKEEWLTDQEYLDFYKEYIPQYLEDGRPLNLQFEGLFTGLSDETLKRNEAQNEPPYMFMTEQNITQKQSAKLLSCGVFSNSFYIGPGGRVLPCMGMDGTPVSKEFPTLWEVPLKTILSKGSRFIEATGYTMADIFEHNEECRDCEARMHCGSGCRALAIGADGTDFMQVDKRICMLCRDDWAGQIREAISEAGQDF